MSGSKQSTWTWEQSRLAAERARRERLAAEARQREIARQLAARRALEEATSRDVRRQAGSLGPPVSQLAADLRTVAAQIDPASRRAFAAELAEAAALAGRAEQAAGEAAQLASLPGGDLVDRGISSASGVFTELGSLAGQLAETLQRAEQIRFHDGPERQRDLAASLGGVGRTVAAAAGVAGVADSGSVRRWSRELGQLWRHLTDGDFDRVQREADRLAATVAQVAAQARLRQDRREERLAVLDALRDTCRQLGYRELNPDEIEQAVEQDEATWRLVVDTLTKGRVTFYIESDQIRAESRIGVRGDSVIGDHCFAEFRRIEAELSAGHGLLTHFTSPVIDRPDPAAGGAAQLPAATERTMGQARQ